MTKRERHLSLACTVLLCAIALYAFLVKPALARIETLERVIPEKRSTLLELKNKCLEYHTLQNRYDQLRESIDSQPQDFELLSFLENRTDRLGLTENVTSMSPQSAMLHEDYSQSSVILELNEVTLKQLVNLLTNLRDGSSFLHIRNLTINKSVNNSISLNSTIHISSINRLSPN